MPNFSKLTISLECSLQAIGVLNLLGPQGPLFKSLCIPSLLIQRYDFFFLECATSFLCVQFGGNIFLRVPKTPRNNLYSLTMTPVEDSTEPNNRYQGCECLVRHSVHLQGSGPSLPRSLDFARVKRR
jgi:hypothetical protein